MSSSGVSESVVQRGKLLVHVAENGHSFELNCDEDTLVESVQKYLESLSGIHLNDQLLLYLDMKLEPQQPLSTYKLPLDDREVFLYNKSKMRNNSTPPQPEEIESPDKIHPDPSRLSSSSNDPHPLEDASDPALKALPSYERQFRYHYQFGDAIYRRTLLKFEICERLLREQKVQEKALEIARGNLGHIYKMILHSYSDFVRRYSHQQKSHSNLLINFWRDLEKLRAIKLIPALQTDNRKSLSDFVKEENLRKMVEDCNNSHRQFESKVGDFKKEFRELKGSTEHLFSSAASIVSSDLEQTIKEHRHYINEQKSIMQVLSKDVSTVKKLVDECLTSQLSNSVRPHDAVSALGPMYDGHDNNYLPKMQACERAVSNLFMFCKDKKSEMNSFVHGYMQKIAYIQYTIRDVRYKFSVFNEAIKHQSDQFEHLRVVRGIVPAYRACLAEIVRRKASMKLYMGMAGQLAEKLASKRESEVRKREEFIKVHSLYIPRDVLALMGLFDTPGTCDVNVAPFDSNLLNLDISDLDRFAPEQYNDSEECIDLEEIAGTSKLEVENAKLKAELASAIARLCFIPLEIEFESVNEGKSDNMLKEAAEKANEALRLKDEYGKQLECILKEKQMQCELYEKRIKELEERLSDQYSKGDSFLTGKIGDSKSEISGYGEAQGHNGQFSEPMDDASYGYNSLVSKSGFDKFGKNLDDTMSDSSGMVNPNSNLDLSMQEPNRDESRVNENDEKEDLLPDDGMRLVTSSTADNMFEHGKTGDLVVDLQKIIEEKSNQLMEMETKLQAATEEVIKLSRDLETTRNLLDESQMNCAHLENCLHEAREEAQTHLCAADRRASEYNALRGSTLKLRSLFERLKVCASSAGVIAFADSLQSLAQSLTNFSSANDNGDDGTAESRECVRAFAKKVGLLAKNCAEWIDRYTKAEASLEQLTKELDEKKELVSTLYMKHQSEKQANKEKISFGRLELHEIAAFVLNKAGIYTAINRNCNHYYLSPESAALYADNMAHRPTYIVGQIVHIERQTVKPLPPSLVQGGHGSGSSQSGLSPGSTDANPYSLAVGCEFFVVTVAMLPDTAIQPPPAAAS